MSDITTDLLQHDRIQNVWCCCCGTNWEELWVGAVLKDDELAIGSLCPRCLDLPPQRAAAQFREFGEVLQTQVQSLTRLFQTRAPANANEVTAQVKRLREETMRRGLDFLRSVEKSHQLYGKAQQLVQDLSESHATSRKVLEEARRILAGQRDLAIKVNDEPSPLESLEEMASEATVLMTLPNAFPKTAQWPVTVSHMIEMERRCVRRRLGGATERDMRLIVDERYRIFLSRGDARPSTPYLRSTPAGDFATGPSIEA